MRPVLILLAGLSAGFQPSSAQAQRKEINLSVVMQQTPAWCWAATASMALRLLDFPDINPAKNYQCGVVAAAFDNCQDDCTKCVTSLGSMQSLVGVLNRYRELSLEFDPASSVDFSPNYVAYPAWTRIKRSLDGSYPVIAGISPDEAPTDPAKSEHTVLITGYEDDRSGRGEGWVIVRDPYPYDRGTSPYTNAGYAYDAASGRARLPWHILRDRMHVTSAVFLESRSA